MLFKEQGKYAEAEPLYHQALEGRRRTLGDEHPSTLVSINNLGMLRKNQGKYAEAESLFREGLEAGLRVLGDEHPYTVHFQRELDTVLAALKAAADKKDEDG